MALVLEDGTGVVGANSYGSVVEADAYFADRNVVEWAGPGATLDDKEGFMIEAADYLNAFYTPRGEPLYVGQAMGLPTLAFDTIPPAFKRAQFELARYRATNGPLATIFGSQPVTSERKQLQGVGEKEVHYATPGSVSNVDQFGMTGSLVAALLRPYTKQGSGIQQASVHLG